MGLAGGVPVEMVEGGFRSAELRNGSGETGLVRGVVGGDQDIGFGQVLGVDEGFRCEDPGFQFAAGLGGLAVGADGPA